jgi:hypothetical protein
LLSPPTVFLRQSRHPAGSREARVGRSGDSARERRVVVLLATSGASCAVKVCREKRRARRQWRELTHADGGHQHCICLIASFPPHRKFALKTPDYMGNRTADRRFKLKTNLIKNLPSFLIITSKVPSFEGNKQDLCYGFFFSARQREARFRMSKGSGRRAASGPFKL